MRIAMLMAAVLGIAAGASAQDPIVEYERRTFDELSRRKRNKKARKERLRIIRQRAAEGK